MGWEVDSPTKRFIEEFIEIGQAELNSYTKTLLHEALLLRAARRAKLTPKKIGSRRYALYQAGVAVAGIDGGLVSTVSHQARRVTNSVSLTRRYLATSGVPTVKSKVFHVSQVKVAAEFFMESQQPALLRPFRSTANAHEVRSTGELMTTWSLMAETCSHLPLAEREIEFTSCPPGVTIQAYVVGEDVHAALAHVPFYVVGDGISTVGELADAEITRRKQYPYLAGRGPEATDGFLRGVRCLREDVLSSGQVRVLTSEPNVTSGWGLTVDVLDELHPSLEALAIDAVWAIPGLPFAGVKLTTPALTSSDRAAVVEVTPEADLADFRYPAFGRGRTVHFHIMDHILRIHHRSSQI